MAEHALMFINAMTPLHNGSGESLGVIDNPVIRERMTGLPYVQSSSIKGVLRDEFQRVMTGEADRDEKVRGFFGPPPGRGEEHSGAVSFSDARLLAFPVRSLKGCFAWATSPFALHRFQQSVGISGACCEDIKGLMDSLSLPLSVTHICQTDGGGLAFEKDGEKRLLLDGFSLVCDESDELSQLAKRLCGCLFDTADTFISSEFKNKLILLPDDIFAYFSQHATEITPNIRIGPTGTTHKGSLRYTEYLPSETILYSVISFEKAKSSNSAEFKEMDTPGNVRTAFFQILQQIRHMQIGGDETIGKGIVRVNVMEI